MPFSNEAKILVDVFRLEEYFCRGAPDHDQAIQLVFLFEVANIFAELLGEIEFVLPFLMLVPWRFLT